MSCGLCDLREFQDETGVESGAPLPRRVRLTIEKRIACLLQPPSQQQIDGFGKVRRMLGVDVVDAFKTLERRLATREEVLIREEIVLPLIGASVIEHDIDELCEDELTTTTRQKDRSSAHSGFRLGNAVARQHGSELSDSIALELLISQGVEESESQFGFRRRIRRDDELLYELCLPS